MGGGAGWCGEWRGGAASGERRAASGERRAVSGAAARRRGTASDVATGVTGTDNSQAPANASSYLMQDRLEVVLTPVGPLAVAGNLEEAGVDPRGRATAQPLHTRASVVVVALGKGARRLQRAAGAALQRERCLESGRWMETTHAERTK